MPLNFTVKSKTGFYFLWFCCTLVLKEKMAEMGTACVQMQGYPIGCGRRKAWPGDAGGCTQRRLRLGVFLCYMHARPMRAPTNLLPVVIVMRVCVFLGGGADLIAFAWGCTRVSVAGVPEDLYGGCCDRIVRLHKCFSCMHAVIHSQLQRTSRGESSSNSPVYTIHLLGWQQVECCNASEHSH